MKKPKPETGNSEAAARRKRLLKLLESPIAKQSANCKFSREELYDRKILLRDWPHGTPVECIEQDWLVEAARRHESIVSGQCNAKCAKKVLRDIRKRLPSDK